MNALLRLVARAVGDVVQYGVEGSPLPVVDVGPNPEPDVEKQQGDGVGLFGLATTGLGVVVCVHGSAPIYRVYSGSGYCSCLIWVKFRLSNSLRTSAGTSPD